jgi:hypothetical protein
MEIIREEEISSKLRKTFRNKSKFSEPHDKLPPRMPTVAAAIIVTNKVTPKTKKKQQPILLSSNLVTNTHINENSELFNNDSSFFNNHQQPITMSRASISSENNVQLKSNEDFYSNQPASTMLDYLKLPKRNPSSQKISQTFKSVVNSLIAERLLDYSKEYDFINDDKNPLLTTTNGLSQNESNFGDSSSTNSKIFTNDGSSLASSWLNMNVNNNNNSSNIKSLNRSKATSFPSNSAQIKRPIIEKKVISTNSTSKNFDQLNEQQNIKKEIKFNKESTLLNVNNIDIKTRLINRSKTLTTMKLSKASKPVLLRTNNDSPSSSNSSLKTQPIVRPITSTAIRKINNNNTNERKTEGSTLIRRQAIKKKNNEVVNLTKKEEKDNDNDDACSYTSASDIFVKSRSSENFNFKTAQSKVVANEKRVLVPALKNSSRQQQHEPPVNIRETPQYHGRWTDMAVNYYLDHQEEDGDEPNSRYNSRYQNFSSNDIDDYNYISSIFKIRRYNLNDSVELEKAKKDLFKRYSFISDPYIKSRLTNLSGLSYTNSQMRSTTPSSSRLSVTVNDRKY